MFTIVTNVLFTFVNGQNNMTHLNLTELFNKHREPTLSGRYITNEMLSSLMVDFAKVFQTSVIGYSAEKRPIYSITVGHGKIKVLLWSQMHGNESTTTKAIIDLLHVFNNSESLQDILNTCTLTILPMLNPDGAHYYTRFNANSVDLNRDAQALSQPESRVLRQVFDAFKPHYCFNLHGQRTIFGAGVSGKPATLSFLTPAEDSERSVTESRKCSMAIIASIYRCLKKELPNAIGRYDDEFNINCVGDTFQSLQVPTLLFEAGHYPNDYQREITRLYVFKALISALSSISKGVNDDSYNPYFEIPENVKNYYDIIVRNVGIQPNDHVLQDVAIQFKEVLKEEKVQFIPIVEKISDLKYYHGHKEIDANGAVASDLFGQPLNVSNEIVFVMLNNHKILLKS